MDKLFQTSTRPSLLQVNKFGQGLCKLLGPHVTDLIAIEVQVLRQINSGNTQTEEFEIVDITQESHTTGLIQRETFYAAYQKPQQINERRK